MSRPLRQVDLARSIELAVAAVLTLAPLVRDPATDAATRIREAERAERFVREAAQILGLAERTLSRTTMAQEGQGEETT